MYILYENIHINRSMASPQSNSLHHRAIHLNVFEIQNEMCKNLHFDFLTTPGPNLLDTTALILFLLLENGKGSLVRMDLSILFAMQRIRS